MIGIYKIQNTINGKCYIGQSVDIHRRWNDHKSSAFNPNNESYHQHLYRAIRKYGLHNFEFSVLEECTVNELNPKERAYITQFDSFCNGYNQTLGGDAAGGQMPKDNIFGIIQDLENTNLSQREIAAKWGVSPQTVYCINVGRNWNHSRTYPIRPKKQNNPKPKAVPSIRKNREQNFCIDCGAPIKFSYTRCKTCKHLFDRHVTRPSKNELLQQLNMQPFVAVAKQYGVSDNAIRKWCKQYGLSTHASDYNVAKAKPIPPDNSRAVDMYSFDGQLLRTFNSPKSAAIALQGKAESIREVCRGRRKSAYGYRWQYHQ